MIIEHQLVDNEIDEIGSYQRKHVSFAKLCPKIIVIGHRTKGLHVSSNTIQIALETLTLQSS